MKAPDQIYIPIIEEDGKKLLCTNWWETDTSSRNAYVNETIPYIRKDIHDETIKTAEDHAYFAGKEKLREELLEWLEEEYNSYPDEIYSKDNYDNGAKDTLENVITKIKSMP